MKIIFDSNVWRIICIPSDFPNDHCIGDFIKIRQAIVDKIIDPYISETVFTIEAIKRVDRQEYFGSSKAKIKMTENANNNNLSIEIGPDEGISFDENPTLKKYFDEAVKLGFKITRLPRIGGIVNNEVEPFRFQQAGKDLEDYHKIVFEVGDKIKSYGAGYSQITAIGEQYDPIWHKGIKKAPEIENTKIAKAAAEWADGDSVAISIALGCDFFCTRDQAKGAGNTSILSVANLVWLNSEYGFKTILPEDLSKLV
ncbi:MAG: hypothetical protein WCK02_00195 [Bacteroidota bacterium]